MPSSRFNPSDSDLHEQLAWHANITAEMQRRVTAAQAYVRTHRNDPELLAILTGEVAS